MAKKNGRAVDPEAPYGWNKDGSPSKKRGRAPGPGTRVPGSGRQKHTMTSKDTSAYLLPKWAQAMDDILSCRPFRVSGPMGKTITRIRNSDEFKHALTVVGNKCLPDQKATQVMADVRSEVSYKEPPTIRELGRAVLSVTNILRTAKLSDETEVDAEPTPAPQGQLLLGRDDVIELQASDPPFSAPAAAQGEAPVGSSGSEPGVPSSSSEQPGGVAGQEAAPSVPEHDETILFDENGAKIVFDATRTKWEVIDVHDMRHAWKRSKEEAVALAERLPNKPSLKSHSGPDQPRPPQTDYAAPVGRSDQMPSAVHHAPKVMRRRPPYEGGN